MTEEQQAEYDAGMQEGLEDGKDWNIRRLRSVLEIEMGVDRYFFAGYDAGLKLLIAAKESEGG